MSEAPSKLSRWERNARDRNRARDRKLPLLAHAGIADQVVPDWTPDAVEERVTRIVEGFHDAMEVGYRRALAKTNAYIHHLRLACPDLDLEEIADEIERKPWLQRPEYCADFWNGKLAEHTGRTKLEIAQEVNRELFGEQPARRSRKEVREQELLKSWH